MEPTANKNPASETFHEVIKDYNKMTLEEDSKVNLGISKAQNYGNYGNIMTRNNTVMPSSKIAKSVQHKQLTQKNIEENDRTVLTQADESIAELHAYGTRAEVDNDDIGFEDVSMRQS